MDGEAEERVELNSASLVTSVSPLMVGRGVETCKTQMLPQGACKGCPSGAADSVCFNMVLSESGTGRRNIAKRSYHVLRF